MRIPDITKAEPLDLGLRPTIDVKRTADKSPYRYEDDHLYLIEILWNYVIELAALVSALSTSVTDISIAPGVIIDKGFVDVDGPGIATIPLNINPGTTEYRPVAKLILIDGTLGNAIEQLGPDNESRTLSDFKVDAQDKGRIWWYIFV